MQSFIDKFKLLNKNPNTLIPIEHITKRGEEKDLISPVEEKIYRSSTGKILHAAR